MCADSAAAEPDSLEVNVQVAAVAGSVDVALLISQEEWEGPMFIQMPPSQAVDLGRSLIAQAIRYN